MFERILAYILVVVMGTGLMASYSFFAKEAPQPVRELPQAVARHPFANLFGRFYTAEQTVPVPAYENSPASLAPEHIRNWHRGNQQLFSRM